MAGTYAGGYHGSGDFEFAGTDQNAKLKARGAANVAAGHRLSEAEHRRSEAAVAKKKAAKKAAAKAAKKAAAKNVVSTAPRPAPVTAGPGVGLVGSAPTSGAGVPVVGGSSTRGPGSIVVDSAVPTKGPGVPSVAVALDPEKDVPWQSAVGWSVGGLFRPALGVQAAPGGEGVVTYGPGSPYAGSIGYVTEGKDGDQRTSVQAGPFGWVQPDPSISDGQQWENRYGDDGPVSWAVGIGVFAGDAAYTFNSKFREVDPRLRGLGAVNFTRLKDTGW